MAMAAPSPVDTLRNIGKYMLVEKLAEGHLGPIYRAIDQDLGRAATIRVLCDGIKWDAKLEELFYHECRKVASLQHPSIAAIFDFGKEGQSPYIAMESLGSNNLEELIAHRSAMPAEAKLSIMIQVAEGLSYAHKKGVLHRDLGPSKIHLTAEGSVKIRDLAIAHVLKKHLPHPAVRWGAPIYLSPEQIQQKDCDERSDIFSAGTVFYELFTQLHPFHDPNGNKALDNVLEDAQIPTFEQFPDVPPGIWPIFKTCLARDPKDRYRSMDELASACKELLKSMAEDTQLMLAELYASLTPLKKASARPGVPPNAINLLQDIEQLSRGVKKADYTSLDRLMTALIEQYPLIQAAAVEPEPICPQVLPAPREVPVAAEAGPAAREKEVEKTAIAPPAQPAIAIPAAPSRPGPIAEFAAPGPMPPAATPEGKAEHPETTPRNAVHGVRQEVEKPAAAAANDATRQAKPPADKAAAAPHNRRIPRPSYRSAAVLLAILVIAAAGYIVLGTEVPAPVRSAWNLLLNARTKLQTSLKQYRSKNAASASATAGTKGLQEGSDQDAASILKEARSLAAENRFAESKALIRKILDINPADPTALAALKEIEERSAEANRASSQPSQALLARISDMIDAGKLQPAKTELDRLLQGFPQSSQVLTLRKKWQNSKDAQDQARKEEEQQMARRQKEDEWNRQVGDLFAHGRYNEASGQLNLWLADSPGNPQAQEFGARIEEIQRNLRVYTSAMSENRYQDALNALHNMERINPADPNLAEMSRQTEARKAAARAVLTVHRLGTKAILLLDGRPIGSDGEIENESIPIGSHTLAIENEGGLIASRSQEYLEGQRVAFVYDMAKLNLRPMTDADRELLAQRKAMEEVHQFELEHDHGALRGTCHGVLTLDYFDVAYKPTSGWHGFRIPFKLLKLKAEGRSIELFYIADNKHFQTFKFQDQQTADKFKQVWSELKAIPQ